MAMLQVFCYVGPPAMLQIDDGSKVGSTACEGEGRLISFSDEEMLEVMSLVK